MKSVIAQKFGGTSVATAERRQMVLGHVRREIEAGHQVALVISAMGRRGDPYATDTVLDLLRTMGGDIEPRNYSFIFVTGEIISVAIVVHMLQQAGIRAMGFTGGMAGIVTEDFPMSARVVSLDGRPLTQCLESGRVPVVCGGQGVTQSAGDFSILGRGGSDTSGVLVGIMTGAERVDIYTDVEYILAADPRVVPGAAKRPHVSYAAAYEMARFGAKVIHPGSVKLGMEHNLPIRVRSTFSQDPGTLISAAGDECPLVGLPLLPSVQVALFAPERISESRRTSLEQHMGVLSLADGASGKLVLCAPAGDTATVVDGELAEDGITNVAWQPGFALVSLIGVADRLAEMDTLGGRALAGSGIGIPYHELTAQRATFVVSEAAGRSAMAALYGGLQTYLRCAQ